MALRFIFDRVENARIRNTVSMTEYVRRVTVVDIPKESVTTAHMALVRILTDAQCPKLGAAYPDPTTGAVLEERNLIAIEQQKRRVELDLVYRTVLPPGSLGSDQIVWTVDDAPTVSHILTNATSNQGAALSVWYKPGEADTTAAAPSGATIKGAQVHKVEVDRTIRVTGRATRTQWKAVRATIRATKARINSVVWGGYARGTWLFLGPHTRTIDRGNTYDISLEFWNKELGWYPIAPYTDEFGNIPKDVAREQAVRQNGPPLEGTYQGRNGVMMASVQKEANFNTIFNFTPDEEPGP